MTTQPQPPENGYLIEISIPWTTAHRDRQVQYSIQTALDQAWKYFRENNVVPTHIPIPEISETRDRFTNEIISSVLIKGSVKSLERKETDKDWDS